jgi:predicted enzyme related to lactoylglutathione lyase
MKMNPVVHFEMPYEDSGRMAGFYNAVFGWQTRAFGEREASGDYVLATTTERDAKTNRPKNPGAINGGFYPKKGDWPAQYPTVVIAVDDIRQSMEMVEKAGGKVLGEPADTGVGLYISFFDTEGNRAAMIQPPPGM